MHSLQHNFSHIYIEEGALEYDATKSILDRFPKAIQVKIRDYKEVFNRPKQNWALQKKSKNLILARKKSDLLYKGSYAAPDFGYDNFYYNAIMLNCMYDCSYCYLQGMYPSANTVVFVNTEDFFAATDEELKTKKPLYLCISYDTDLMAFEAVYPFARKWIEFAKKRPDLIIELRTKSANYKTIANLKPSPNIILAWTISPSEVAKRYESKTPSLKARVASAAAAINDGWKVRLCFDPILEVNNWESIYSKMLNEVFNEIPGDRVHDVSIGTFRMNKQYFKTLKKKRPALDVLYQKMTVNGSLVSYEESLGHTLANHVREQASKFVAPDKVSIF